MAERCEPILTPFTRFWVSIARRRYAGRTSQELPRLVPVATYFQTLLPASPPRPDHDLGDDTAVFMPCETARMTWDVIVVGSGFGGAMAAHAFVQAGRQVLMLERGGWVARGPQNWRADGVGLATPYYTMESPYHVSAAGRHFRVGAWHCVGGQSV
jgi:NADPH-dependent 2,4-dienoyl-CoA reductase/sulfur reductase-like enzyme